MARDYAAENGYKKICLLGTLPTMEGTFFLQNPKKILSKTQILENVFDLEGDFVDENTIAVNIRRLREKIEDNPAAPVYIKNIRGLGYIWNQEVRQ